MVEVGERHYSITLGTAKKPCSATGALASTSSRLSPSVTTSSRRRSCLVDHRGHRLDAGDIDLAELLDPAEDVVELGHQRLDLGVADGDAGELGDMADVSVSTDMGRG